MGPHQLWEWDGDVRLAGAALPWGEAQGALAAPEGGRSPAADLYALGVTLLRMGPLPAGLSDLLSPYPAQRPSARDALARFNAGPPLPTPPSPLMVQAPLHPREPGPLPAPDAPLPLIADPEQRVAPSSSDPLPSALLPPAVPAPTPGAEACRTVRWVPPGCRCSTGKRWTPKKCRNPAGRTLPERSPPEVGQPNSRQRKCSPSKPESPGRSR